MEDSTVTLDLSWKSRREQVNLALSHYVRQGKNCPSRLQEAMAYSLLADGKRLRPVLVLMACEACGGDSRAAMPAACALEMIHAYSLIHDDLPAMDNDALRRGRPTNHVVYGEALAILAGDGLLTLAFEIVAREVQPPTVAAQCCADLAVAAGACGMVGGQAADIEAETGGIATVAELEAIHRRKTGALLCSALTLGGRVAQANEETLSMLRGYGQCLGLAFQIADDLLDVHGNPEKVGKGLQKDSARGKQTYPALLGVEASAERAAELVAEACRLIAPLGERSRHLDALAHFVIERDH